MSRRWFWIGAAALLVLVYAGVRSLTRDRLSVRVAQASHEQLASTTSTNGRVEPVKPIQIYTPIAAIVKAVYVQPGDQVPQGKLLMTLDDVDARAKLASADSAVKAAQANLEAAEQNGTLEQRQAAAAEVTRNQLDLDQSRRDLEALLQLSGTGAASPSEVAAARQHLATAEANLHASQQTAQLRYSPAEIARARAAVQDAEANRQAAQQLLSQTAVQAPSAGNVYSLNVRATEFAEQGKLLLQMADLNHMLVRAYFDEPEIGKLSVGQPVLIKWDARPGVVWHGHIERTPAAIEQYETRRVGQAIIQIEDSAIGQLMPDTTVTVTATTSSESNALSIPREALRTENGRTYVFKVVGDELKKTFVITGTLNLTQVAILSGLQDGDWVATGTQNGQPLQEGIPIKRVQ